MTNDNLNKRENMWFPRHLITRTYNFEAKTGIKRLNGHQVLARGGGRKVLSSHISMLESRRVWEDLSLTSLKNARKRATAVAKELNLFKNVNSSEDYEETVSILGRKRNIKNKKQIDYLVVKKHRRRNCFLKMWVSGTEINNLNSLLNVYAQICVFC